MPAWRMDPPSRCFQRQASPMNSALPASTAPSGAPSPLVKSTQTESKEAAISCAEMPAATDTPTPDPSTAPAAAPSITSDKADYAPGELVSLLPVHGAAERVTTEGLAYPLRAETLEAGTTRGVSNVFATETARVSLDRGVLLAIRPGVAT